MKPCTMSEIIAGKRYNTETATLLAGDDWWDGHNFERRGRQTYLYRTPKGGYFAAHLTQWMGERDHIEPLAEGEAVTLWEQLTERRVEWEEAFPGMTVEDA